MPHYQTLYSRAPRSKVRGRRGAEPARRSYLSTILILIALGLPLLAKVHLDRETLRMGRTWEARKADLQNLTQKSENLRVERESYLRGDYIRNRAGQMGLRPAQPGQVRFMQVADSAPATPANPGTLVASRSNVQ